MVSEGQESSCDLARWLWSGGSEVSVDRHVSWGAVSEGLTDSFQIRYWQQPSGPHRTKAAHNMVAVFPENK